MAGGLGAVAAGLHVAPAPSARGRRVVERPAARLVGAGAEAIRPATPELSNDGRSEGRQGIADLRSAVLVANAQRRPIDVEPRTVSLGEGAIDGVHGGSEGRAVLNDRIEDLAESIANRPYTRQIRLGPARWSTPSRRRVTVRP